MTADISRTFADPDKLFRSVVRQQGRLPTDAEENAAGEIAGWLHDAEFTETITPLGTPDDGFRITVSAGALQIGAGSYYLGGARVENAASLAYPDQVKGNWLTQPATAPAGRVVVWLEVEERVVTAVQDAELLEPALRGPDGAGRTRLCWRVRQATTAATDCEAALAGALGNPPAALVDPETGAILPTGKLTIGFDNDDVDQNLCAPKIETGYLGNRNNTFRIKRSRAGRFVWGEDNGAQLYRVTVDPDKRTIHFLTEPRDEYLRPKAGQTVELLRGDVLLPNFEKVAEPDGQFFTVSGGYSDGAITVASDVDATWLAWLPSTPVDPDADPSIPRHFYLRVWTGGGEGGQPDFAFTPGTPRNLTGTGLTATFTDTTIIGDGWTCAARPDAPMRVLPWGLLKGMHPHGPRRHVAPLAIVDLATGDVHDCRSKFRPLYRIHNCCSVEVGAPDSHMGDTESIAAAIAMLPPEGGTVCLLAGDHVANVELAGLKNIRFTGCPGRTRWLAEKPELPLVTLTDTQDISFHNIAFVAGKAPCIVSGKSKPLDDSIANGGLVIEHCLLEAPYGGAVVARHEKGVRLFACRIVAGPFPEAAAANGNTALPALFLQGSDLVVEQCRIIGGYDPKSLPAERALGGIQIGGGSERVLIRDCIIRDGSGIGITLGSIIKVKVPADEYAKDPEGTLAKAIEEFYQHGDNDKDGFYLIVIGFVIVISPEGCINVDPVPPDPSGGDGTLTIPVSEGLVSDVAIEHNRIVAMGSSGIASYPLAPLLADGDPAPDAVAVERLYVADNEILDCARLETKPANDLTALFMPLGGIALTIANDCLFRGNEIAGNGPAAGGPVVGIGIIAGEDIRIEANRMERNGHYARAGMRPGPNAAISLALVIGGLSGFTTDETRKSDRPALHIHGNIVHQPAGRAIRALAIGPVMVADNRLTGANPSRLFAAISSASNQLANFAGPSFKGSAASTPAVMLDLLIDLAGGDAVNIVNLGVAEDLFTIMLAKLLRKSGGDISQTLLAAVVLNAYIQQLLPPYLQRGGETLFDDNQVSLRRPEPAGPQGSLSSIFILSLDDISFADNQYEVEANRALAFFNALLLGASIRTTSNRGQEAALCVRSILSRALLWNTAALNQTTMGIDADATMSSAIIDDNLSA